MLQSCGSDVNCYFCFVSFFYFFRLVIVCIFIDVFVVGFLLLVILGYFCFLGFLKQFILVSLEISFELKVINVGKIVVCYLCGVIGCKQIVVYVRLVELGIVVWVCSGGFSGDLDFGDGVGCFKVLDGFGVRCQWGGGSSEWEVGVFGVQDFGVVGNGVEQGVVDGQCEGE